MKKKISFVLLLIGLFGCTNDLDLNAPKEVGSLHLKTAASSTNPYFPLFQLFIGKTNEECDAKIDAMVSQFFSQSNSNRLYYEVGNNMAYIYDTGNSDVRSEGMSYGMMITVQLDMKTEFDKL